MLASCHFKVRCKKCCMCGKVRRKKCGISHFFVVDTGEKIIPVEVKAELNLRAKSLKTYYEKFSPDLAVRTSMADYKKEDWLLNQPLYTIESFAKI